MRQLVLSYHTCPLDEPGQNLSGGMNIFLRGLLPALVEEGIESEVWTRGERAETLEMAPGVVVRRLPCGFSQPWTREKAWECLPRFLHAMPSAAGFQVASAHYWMSGIAARQLGLPWTMAFHTLQELRGGPDTLGRAAVERELAQEAFAVVCMTSLDQRRSASVLPPFRARVIPPGVELGPPRAPAHNLLYLVAARDEPAKNVPVAIRAIEQLEGARLLVVGQTGLDTPKVSYLGTVAHSRMNDLYRKVDAVLCPSDYESFGLVVLEALAQSVPVIVNAEGGYWGRVGRAIGVPLSVPLDCFGRALRRPADAQRARALASRFTWKRSAQRWAALLRDGARSALRVRGEPLPD